MDKLYFFPGTCALVPHIVLEETGHPYELVKVNLQEGEHVRPPFSELNPLRRLPVFVSKGSPIIEVNAIAQHLAAAHPETNLLPAVGSDDWTHFHELLSVLSTSVHPSFNAWYFPDRYAPAEVSESVRTLAKERYWGFLSYLDRRLMGKEYFLGARYSIADAYLALYTIWGRLAKLPVEDLKSWSASAERVFRRPAVQRALAQEGLRL
jgi:glutathione S-transferase